jgi:hypothetical protein
MLFLNSLVHSLINNARDTSKAKQNNLNSKTACRKSSTSKTIFAIPHLRRISMNQSLKRRLWKIFMKGNSLKVGKWIVVVTTVAVGVFMSEPAHALLLDPARQALAADLTASGFTQPEVIGLFFGLLEFILIAIPVGTGSMALANMNRGAEAWLPWITTMGGALVFIAFITVLVNQIYA